MGQKQKIRIPSSIEYFKHENRPPYFTAFITDDSNDDGVDLDGEDGGVDTDVTDRHKVASSLHESESTLGMMKTFSSVSKKMNSLTKMDTASWNGRRMSSASITSYKSATRQNTAYQNLVEDPNSPPLSIYSDIKVIPTWRLKERMKTVGVCLVLALNIGTDPPDLNRPTPCAKLQCWMDPSLISRAKAREQIGEKLEAQYARWQQRSRLRYKRALDPTIDEVRNLCISMRRHAKNERLLLHYNGHGVPRPTVNGEIWLFDQNHKHYVPLCVNQLRSWIGKPIILVLDCRSAGVLMPFLTTPLDDLDQYTNPINSDFPDGQLDEAELAARSVRDCIVLCPCSENELLPMNPEFPADIFTSCLTTPIPIALRWFVHQNPLSMAGFDPESVDRIPGKENDRKTPLGELNWIFTAITDAIAWNVLPSPLFQRLFRQDLLVASMFRNFLLADRILRSLNCTPMSYPSLPSTSNHPLWQAWDLAVETCLHGLMKNNLLNLELPPSTTNAQDENGNYNNNNSNSPEYPQRNNSTAVSPFTNPRDTSLQYKNHGNNFVSANISQPTPSVSSPFFAEQLTGFEIWLEFASRRAHLNDSSQIANKDKFGTESPEQLPVVLQVLLSQVHRVRALVLLKRFLDLGPWAVNLALSVGIFPYVLKLLKSHVDEYKHVLVGIWAKVLAFDPSCQVDLVKDSALDHFIGHLNWGSVQNIQSSRNKKDMFLFNPSSSKIDSNLSAVLKNKDVAEQRAMAAFILSIICQDYPQGKTECLKQNLHRVCSSHLYVLERKSPSGEEIYSELDEESVSGKMQKSEIERELAEETTPPIIRQWLCICLGNLWKDCETTQSEAYKDGVFLRVYSRLDDYDPHVRAAAAYALGCLIENTSVDDSKTKQTSTTQTTSASVVLPPINHYKMGMNSSSLNLNNDMGPPQPMLSLVPPASKANSGEVMNIVGLPWQQQNQNMYNQTGNMTGHPFPGMNSAYSTQHGNSYGSGAQFPSSGILHPHPITPAPARSSIFENTRRLKFDLDTAEKLVEATSDASPVVRYESTLGLGCLVGKYLPAFAAIADEMASLSTQSQKSISSDHGEEDEKVDNDSHSNTESVLNNKSLIEYPSGLNSSMIDRFRNIWVCLRFLQHDDPHPAPSHAANAIVSVVHEYILSIKTKSLSLSHQHPSEGGLLSLSSQRPDSPMNSNTDIHSVISSQESHSPKASHYFRTQSMNVMTGNLALSPRNPQIDHRTSHEVLNRSERFQMRRIDSLPLNPATGNKKSEEPTIHSVNQHNTNNRTTSLGSDFKIEYSLPKSKFFKWKRLDFEGRRNDFSSYANFDDPLSHLGEVNSSRKRRNMFYLTKGTYLSQYFSCLVPKAKNTKGSSNKNNSDLFSTFSRKESIEDENDDGPSALALEMDISDRKKKLQLKLFSVLHNQGADMTTMVNFHPYDPALVVFDGNDGISAWDVSSERSNRVSMFKNENPKGSRMTSTTWINEESNSLLLVASDNGSLKLWDGIIDSSGNISKENPKLATSFFADRNMVPGQRGSGLVTEWQQFTGRLITGGNGDSINCWDMEAEKCTKSFTRNSNACVTTITTAWDKFNLQTGNDTGPHIANGYAGIGPDIIVAGYGNGSMKVFDIRSPSYGSEISTNLDTSETSTRKARRPKLMNYDEHSSWIVDTFFTGYGGRHELVSGCVAGDVKFWDIRCATSLRTLTVQRSPMTALAGHPRIPFLVTGSHAQFLKIFTTDGDAISTIRYHEGLGQRIGPVSCLKFHPHKLLLAVGTTDAMVSLYG